MLLADVIFDARQPEIAEFARTNALPAIYNKRAFAEAGGFMSYGARYDEFFRQAARYVDHRILRGAKPGELPVVSPTQFEFSQDRRGTGDPDSTDTSCCVRTE